MPDYPKPSLTADCVVLRPAGPTYELLLIRRKHEPFAGRWALPGGFVDAGETTRQAAIRELQEETGVEAAPFLELGVADRPGRDPRGWTVSNVWAFVVPAGTEAVAGDDAQETGWLPWTKSLGLGAELGFDHAEVLEKAAARFEEQLLLPDGWRSFVPTGHADEEAEEGVWSTFGRA